MRKGPRPLSVQIGMAASLPQDHYAAGSLTNGLLVPTQIQKMLLGIQSYRTHSYSRPEKRLRSIWKSGEVKIQALSKSFYHADNECILLIPSLINKAYIFDLMPERSMLRYLASQGLNVYLLNWGQPTRDKNQSSFEDVIFKNLLPAIEFLSQHEQKKIHALGYCMGGTLLTAAASTQNDVYLKSIILLASPWDFHAGTKTLLSRIQFWAPSAFPAIEEKGVLSVDWLQTVFASLDPAASVRKFANFEDMAPDDPAAHLFIAIEDWLNDGIDLPGHLAQQCIKDWYLNNYPARNKWVLNNQAIDPQKIKIPALIVASDKDRLVEYDTSVPLANLIENSTIINPSCGHIGMIAGKHSIETVWEPLARWLQS